MFHISPLHNKPNKITIYKKRKKRVYCNFVRRKLPKQSMAQLVSEIEKDMGWLGEGSIRIYVHVFTHPSEKKSLKSAVYFHRVFLSILSCPREREEKTSGKIKSWLEEGGRERERERERERGGEEEEKVVSYLTYTV